MWFDLIQEASIENDLLMNTINKATIGCVDCSRDIIKLYAAFLDILCVSA